MQITDFILIDFNLCKQLNIANKQILILLAVGMPDIFFYSVYILNYISSVFSSSLRLLSLLSLLLPAPSHSRNDSVLGLFFFLLVLLLLL